MLYEKIYNTNGFFGEEQILEGKLLGTPDKDYLDFSLLLVQEIGIERNSNSINVDTIRL